MMIQKQSDNQTSNQYANQYRKDHKTPYILDYRFPIYTTMTMLLKAIAYAKQWKDLRQKVS